MWDAELPGHAWDRVDVFVTKSDPKEDLDFNDLSDMDFLRRVPEALEGVTMDKGGYPTP